MIPTFVVYGNCQAGVLREATRFIPAIQDNFEVVYYQSFDHPVDGIAVIDPKIMSRCHYLWCQVDNNRAFPFEGETPEAMKKVVFPSMDLGVLWPNQTPDPLFTSEPDYPYGMFPYGDRLLIKTAQAVPDPGQAYLHFEAQWAEQRFPFDRYLDVEIKRLIQREQATQVKMAAFVISHFRTERLFWSYNHPTNTAFSVLLNRLMMATFTEANDPCSELYGTGDRIFETWDPFSVSFQVPVYAPVAKALGLLWWSPGQAYYFHRDEHLTIPGFVERYVTERMRRQSCGHPDNESRGCLNDAGL